MQGARSVMGTESESLSTYATVWLTLISGVILVKAAQQYWTLAIRATHKRNIPAYVNALLDRMPGWTDYFAFVPLVAMSIAVLTIGYKLLFFSGLDTIVRVQVGLAMSILVGWLGGGFVKKADARLQLRPFKPIYLVPMTVVIGIIAFGVYAMMVKCPEHLAEQWWMPCFH